MIFLKKNSSRYGSRFSNKLHQNKVFNVKITENGQCVDTVRFALKRKISVKTLKREHLNHGRVRASVDLNGLSRKTVRYGRVLWINSEPPTVTFT